MLEYTAKVQRAFIEQLHFEENPTRPGLPLQVPDGAYPLKIEEKWDLVRIKQDQIHCRNFDQFVPARMGYFRRDDSGLWHYITGEACGTRWTFAPDAIEHRPSDQAAMFWFNRMPAPIYMNDTSLDLARRSNEWAESLRLASGFFKHLFESLQVKSYSV